MDKPMHSDITNIVLTAPVGICILDAATLVSEIVNDKFIEVAGKVREQIYGKFYWDAFKEARQFYEQALDAVVKTGEPFYADEVALTLIRHGHPELVFATFVYSPVTTATGKVVKVAIWVLENTTQVIERQKLEIANQELVSTYKRLDESQNELLFTLKAAGLATFDLNPFTNRFAGNSLLKSWFGLKDDEEINLSVATDVISEGDRSRVLDAIRLALSYESGGIYDVEYSITSKNDLPLRYVRARGKTLFNAQHEPIRLSGVLQDITEQRNDDHRKNAFIGMVSHELKTPLTSLSGYLQILQLKLANSDDSFIPLALEKANFQVKKMAALINGFLNVSRLESGKIQIDKHVFDLEQLMEEAVKETEFANFGHNIHFQPCRPVMINADYEKIGSVITNLISNAGKYSEKGQGIDIICEVKNDKAIVSVRDAGIGIKSEDLEKIFEPYYRVEDNKNHISGFGIGLYLSAEIIRRHEGRIWVESEQGVGSSFYFSLPLAE